MGHCSQKDLLAYFSAIAAHAFGFLFKQRCINTRFNGQLIAKGSGQNCCQTILVVVWSQKSYYQNILEMASWCRIPSPCTIKHTSVFPSEEVMLNCAQPWPVWHAVWLFVKCNGIQKNSQHQPPFLSSQSTRLASLLVSTVSSCGAVYYISRGSHQPSHP